MLMLLYKTAVTLLVVLHTGNKVTHECRHVFISFSYFLLQRDCIESGTYRTREKDSMSLWHFHISVRMKEVSIGEVVAQRLRRWTSDRKIVSTAKLSLLDP